MKLSGISSTKQDYIRAIYYLFDLYQREVTVTELARLLNLKKSTVTERLQDLSKQKFVISKKYGGVSLTKKGESIAKYLTRKHRIIEVFLHQTLKRPIKQVHDEAHLLEHAFSDESIDALYKLLGKPFVDPHGRLIPNL